MIKRSLAVFDKYYGDGRLRIAALKRLDYKGKKLAI